MPSPLVALAAVLVLGAAAPPALAATPPGLVDVRAGDATIRTDVRYAGRRNFTGRRLPGYCAPRALLLPRAARALARVQRRLRRRGLGLKVYDAYRPARASRAMVRWARRVGRPELVSGGYIARRSNHNLATTVDLTLVRLRGGAELDMGTRFDAFTPGSATVAVRGRPLHNRLTLRRAMEREGFANYAREWWHYDSRMPGPRRLDAGIGC